MKNNDWSTMIDILANKYQTNQDKIIDNLTFAIEKAYLKEYPDVLIEINIRKDNNSIDLFELRKVVEDYPEIDDDQEVSLEEAKTIDSKLEIGDVWKKPIAFANFERRMAGHVRQVFDQKMSEVANSIIYDQWKDVIGSVIKAPVEEDKERYVEVNLGSNIKGVVLKADQIKNEFLEMNEKYFFYVKEVKESTKGWPIILSRNHPGLIENLIREFIDEVKNGLVEIKAIARIAGFKTKVAVQSTQPGIDPIGSCVGMGGERIKSITKEVNGEFIDFIKWDDDLKQLIVNACAPHKLVGIEINDDEDNLINNHKLISLVLEESTIPKLIGKAGANLKLISKITNCTIEGIFSVQDAIENQIDYIDVQNLSPTNSTPRTFVKAYRERMISDEDFDNEFESLQSPSKPKRDFKKPSRQNYDVEQVYETSKYNNQETQKVVNDIQDIDDSDFEQIMENIIVPKREKVVTNVVYENIDDIFFDEKEESDFDRSKPRYKKAKSPKKAYKEEVSIFEDEVEDFQDITEDSLNFDEEISFSDNLEIDEEEE